jgi:demethylmenaquinone methyltransferase/2-methoxy-6-polyprenyl-1,4-benzoquinol methylase
LVPVTHLPVARALPVPTPGAPEKEAVRGMFDRIAPRYDLLNRVLSAGIDRRWRRACVDFLALAAPSRILDLCTGTGDLLLEALGRDGGHRGLGLDLSLEMLRRARAKAVRQGARATLAAADAERLPLPDASFDAAMVAFGIRNVGDVAAALSEARRVLKPGGRLVVLEFGLPRGPGAGLYRAYFDKLLPLVGRVVSGDAAYSYLPASVARFPAGPAFAELMAGAGFAAVDARPLLRGVAWLYRGDKAAR